MAEVSSGEHGHDPNYPAHARNYEGFLTLLKWSMLVIAIVTAIVLLIIAN
ncbi:aa3-type cytochrome c oxidase subunit IV [Sphingomonas sp. HDW15A]|nr:aa3-type cytochrome c oxidase subunit IV [Sphingomonas sp. HDW15A]QIK95702.1 aa3-type cytochrome c oxidase subunit IV [Sphingomonas sp. HDW15A]